MTRSPNRMTIDYVHALIKDMPTLNKGDFERIEQAGCCKLSEKLKDQTIRVLESFTRNKALENEAYTRGDLYTHLKNISESAAVLHEIFGNPRDHAKRVSSFKVDDEFEEAIGEVGPDLSARWALAQKYYCQDLGSDDHIDFVYFADNCLIISCAAKRAIKKMDDEIAVDNGGRNVEVLNNSLLKALDNIYCKATGRKKAEERFILECIRYIPESDRPKFGQAAGSITQQLARIKKTSS